jgi:nitrite reductase (NO-forming)
MTRDLPIATPAIPDGACCAACAAQPVVATPTVAERSPAPLSAVGPAIGPARVVRRADDRRTTFGGLLVAAAFVGLATLWIGLTTSAGGSAWAALHILLAGAAGTAIASVLPFFTSALAQVPPADRRIRVAAIGLVAGGALAVTLGVSAGHLWLATLGGCAYLAGIGLVAVAAFAPLRSRVGAGTGIVPIAYAVALANVAVGVAIATAAVAGWAPVVSAWAQVKPAHAWLNVFGFVSLIVAATLVHLAPTVAGSRIRPRRSTTVALVAMMAAPPLVAIGFIAGSAPLAVVGAGLEVVGATALLAATIGIRRDRGRWTSDREWHRFTGLSLLAAPAWFLVATLIAAARVMSFGATPEAWSMAVIGVPLAIGWTAQVLIGSWTHLVPAIGPGDQAAHATQRGRLGRWGTVRVVVWNAAVAALTVGILVGVETLVMAGAVVIAACVALAIALLIVPGTIRHGGVQPV